MYPADLITLPLHTITEAFGSDGLRERFSLEISGFPAAERAQLEQAMAWASQLHRDDRRVREPYVNHLLRVTIRIVCYYYVRDVEVLTAALLHDAVEDHPAEIAGLPTTTPLVDAMPPAVESLAARYGRRVADLVSAVTNPVYAADRDVNEQYREHVATSLSANPWARVIKLSDFTDNAVGIVWAQGDKVRSGATKYRPLIPILRELLARPDTPLEPAVKQHIFEQLATAERRFADILDPTPN